MSDIRKHVGQIARQLLGEEQVVMLKRFLGMADSKPSQRKQLMQSIERLIDNSQDTINNLPEPGPDAPRVLLYAANGRALTNVFEGLLAYALQQRGAKTDILFCDQVFDYCDARYISTEDKQGVCDRCFQRAVAFFGQYRLPVLHFSQYAQPVDYTALREQWIAAETKTPLIDVTYKDIKIGHLAYSSTLHYLLIGTFDLDDPLTRSIFLNLLVHTAQLVDTLEAVIAQHKPDIVLQTHSLYILWGTMADVCRKHGIPFYDYFFGYRQNTLVFGKQNPYQWELINEPLEHWRDVPLNDSQERLIRDYMQHRELGDRDDIAYFRDVAQSAAEVRQQLKLDDRPILGAFPNLGWDGAVLFRDSAFNHLFDWALGLVAYAQQHPEIQLVIRSHPAEVQKANRSRETVQDVILREFPTLPENVRVIGPEEQINSYALMPLLTAATVYTSKVGFELAQRGIPVVVAGMAFYRNRGFTFDASTADEFYAYLDQMRDLKAIHETGSYSDLALRFSYYFFFQKYVDITFLRWKYQQDLTIEVNSLADLAPGHDASMDLVCDILLNDHPTYLTLEEGELLRQAQAEKLTAPS